MSTYTVEGSGPVVPCENTNPHTYRSAARQITETAGLTHIAKQNQFAKFELQIIYL